MTKPKPKKRPEEGKTLREIAHMAGAKSDKHFYTARRRSRERIAAGSDEAPFPEPVRVFRGTEEYWDEEVLAWAEGHSLADNPSRHRPRKPRAKKTA